MTKNIGVSFLIICFGFSNINLGWATQVMEVSPVIVQPYEIQELNQEMINRDRKNRDEEIAIKQIVEENDQLTRATLARQQDEGLAKINQTMLSYRDALLSRDRARIVANSHQEWGSRYGDLIALTEDADAMTVHRHLVEEKSGALAEKYQMLTALKDEMTALNEKLRAKNENIPNPSNPQETTIDGFKRVAQEQQDKIQMLTQRLEQMDQKIAKYDEIIAQKDHQIMQLKEQLSLVQDELTVKNATIKDQEDRIALLQHQPVQPVEALTQPVTASSNQPQAPQAIPSLVSQDEITKLKEDLSTAQHEVALKNETIKEQEDRIALLRAQPAAQATPLIAAKDDIIKEKQGQVDLLKSELENQLVQNSPKDNIIKEKQAQLDLLKSELENKITQEKMNDQPRQDGIIKQQEDQIAALKAQLKELSSKEEPINTQANQMAPASAPFKNNSAADQSSQHGVIKQQEDQINTLKAQLKELSSKEELVNAQANQMARASEQFKNNSAAYANIKKQIMALIGVIHRQSLDLKAKNDSIRWLHQVLGVAKNKAEYYRLSSQINKIPTEKMQEEMRVMKTNAAEHFKDYDQFEKAISSLKNQVGQLGVQLSEKQGQVDQLQSALAERNAVVKNLARHDVHMQQELQGQLQDKENQIVKMKSDIAAILQAQANKEVYRQHTKAQVDDRIKLAQQLINLQWQETALLDEKSNLEAAQNDLFDQHASALENKIKALLSKHQLQTLDLENRMQELKDELGQKQEQVNSLEMELKNKIADEKNQTVLSEQIQDLKSQLQDKEYQINTMKTQIAEGQKMTEESDTLKQQLAAEQDKANQLKEQLDAKTAQSEQLVVMMRNDQKKLHSSDNANNEQSRQIADLNAQLQEKETEIGKIKQDMENLQEMTNAKDRDIQTKDLSLSMVQQKAMDAKINEYEQKINALQATNVKQLQEIIKLKTDLALARQELGGMPSSDEIDFLRAGLKKTTLELNQKSEMLSQIKANSSEYAKEFKEQTREFQSLKDQLLDAQQKIARRDEDVKYRDMALIRLKRMMGPTHEGKTEPLQEQLKRANLQIKDLQAELNQLKSSDVMEAKLKQALDKIDEQGKIINILAKRLQDAGKSINLTKDADK